MHGSLRGDSAPSWHNIDGIVVVTSCLSLSVIFLLLDPVQEFSNVSLSLCATLLFTLARYSLAWWAEDHDASWRYHFNWRNIGACFWFVQLLLALSFPDSVAPLAHNRLHSGSDIVTWTFIMAGFLCGVEPGTVRQKCRGALVIVVLIVSRLFILAMALQHMDDGARARELTVGGLKKLVFVPCLGALVGTLTRVKLDARTWQLRRAEASAAAAITDAAAAAATANAASAESAAAAATAELGWLREHTRKLEAARLEALRREHSSMTGSQLGLEPPSEPPLPSNASTSTNGTHEELVAFVDAAGGGDRMGLGSDETKQTLSFVAAAARVRVQTPPRVLSTRQEREDALWRSLSDMTFVETVVC